jgi:hypothetical protein
MNRSVTSRCITLQMSPEPTRSIPLLGRQDGSCRPLIEIEQPAQPRTSWYTTRHLDGGQARDEAIVQSLVIPFVVVVFDILRHGPAEMPLSDRNQSVKALFLD